MISIAEALSVVAKSPNHRILQRLPEMTEKIVDQETRRGFYVDVETTGLDVNVDEIIEFGGIPFKFTLDGLHVEVLPSLHFYNEPRKAITEEITKITKITTEMVAGSILDVKAIEAALAETDIVIAHNSAYDRPIVERYVSSFADKHWGCSMVQPNWGTATRKLEYLLSTMGYFYEAHNAVTDCKAGLFAIAQPLGNAQGVTGLAQILEASRAKAYHVWAVDAPFDMKDDLKKNGYYWSGDKRCWNKEIFAPDTANLERLACDEENFLKPLYARHRKAYKARFDRVTAKERFTKRG